ncbi:hypothetical protein J6590_005604 [Homalodisca vitripennis]|nr:hypothetical protein J6590_005604 [Homalodisca vitripennis]
MVRSATLFVLLRDAITRGKASKLKKQKWLSHSLILGSGFTAAAPSTMGHGGVRFLSPSAEDDNKQPAGFHGGDGTVGKNVIGRAEHPLDPERRKLKIALWKRHVIAPPRRSIGPETNLMIIANWHLYFYWPVRLDSAVIVVSGLGVPNLGQLSNRKIPGLTTGLVAEAFRLTLCPCLFLQNKNIIWH